MPSSEVPRPSGLERLAGEVSACRACPRLVAHREEVSRVRRKSFVGEEYWGRGVPGFGDPAARLVIVGLAPGAHGSNRTGRPFTGDASGDFLYPALHRAGFASQATASGRDDGLTLRDCWITAAVRCAPPDNRPTPEEFARCAPYLERELASLERAEVWLAFGQLAYESLGRALPRIGVRLPERVPKFAHGISLELDDGRWLAASYHPSRQNTQTGRLTRAMFDAVFAKIGSRWTP